jgi:dCTP deaminase
MSWQPDLDPLLNPVPATSATSAVADADTADETPRSTGILTIQELQQTVGQMILCGRAIEEDQFQPASLDLRLGTTAYRVRASFLPGRERTVKDRLDDLSMHEMDLTHGAVLERGCVYIVPLLESLSLRHRLSAIGNPKSSTGRLDVFTRLITDHGTEFDRVRESYKGPLYAEVSPRTFSVLVRTGSRLNQIRLRRGNPQSSNEKLRRLQEQFQLVGTQIADDDIRNGVPITVDVSGDRSGGIIGFKARSHAGLIDIDRINGYDVADYWEPVQVPTTLAAEMIAYDTLVGEFRVHYAGFFDPGFGIKEAGGAGSRAVLEVRSYEVPFVIEDGQVVGRLTYEQLTGTPARLYGATRSSYQGQGIKLSKHFRPFVF